MQCLTSSHRPLGRIRGQKYSRGNISNHITMVQYELLDGIYGWIVCVPAASLDFHYK